MVKLTFLAGGYTSFIATYLFNTDTSSLSLVGKSTTGVNPSWLTRHPTNSSVIYAVNEIDNGGLQSFSLLDTGLLSPAKDTILTNGGAPAFADVLSTGQVVVMNYNGGNGRVIPTDAANPLDFIDQAPTITFPPPSGGVSHPHMALQYKNEIFVPDLGGDKVWRLKQNGAPGSWDIAGFIPQPKGSGPRHIAVVQDRLFVLHELSSTLTLQTIPSSPSVTNVPLIANVSIVPSDPAPGAVWAAGEILIPPTSPSFPKQYIYVSNRNTGTQTAQGDSIAIFERVLASPKTKEGLRLVKQVFTGLNQVRGMEFSAVTQKGEQFLVAAGVAGTAGVKVFKRTSGGSDLVEVAKETTLPTGTSFLWV
jgi:6-phosphogluconolactonase (cycloisomerase 2 family)